MQIFEALKCITGIPEYSRLVYEMVKKAGTEEKLAQMLSDELTEEQLRTLQSVAAGGNYPISLDGIQ